MVIGLHNLKAPVGAHKKKKILGRGPSSGHGKTSTRGHKGQTARTGHSYYPGFEGGQMPLIRKVSKRGFTSRNLVRYQIINLKDLNKIDNNVITPEVLVKGRIIKNKKKPIKILGEGSVNKSIIIKGINFSKTAQTKIEKAGGVCFQR